MYRMNFPLELLERKVLIVVHSKTLMLLSSSVRRSLRLGEEKHSSRENFMPVLVLI